MDDRWPFPGSRWWKMDFHTHTPASLDTKPWQDAIGTKDEVTPEIWIQKYMAAEIDIVVITDHNTGAWIDKLKSAYENLKSKHQGSFRELHIFPGIEISVNGGFHLLAIFGPSSSTSDIDSFIGAINYQGIKGECDGTTGKGAAEVVKEILDRNGIPIPAHVDDSKKGMLRTQGSNSKKADLDSNTLRQIFEIEGILAMEQLDLKYALPEIYNQAKLNWTSVIGSDSHSFQGKNKPGSRFTWVKMAEPTLEGIRLALLDGNGISIRRSDKGSFDPFRPPNNFIESIEVDKAQYMGRKNPEILNLSPYYNALIGGRGTGKSTIVHSLRLGFRRENELNGFADKTSPKADFHSFRQIVQKRNDEGALRDETSISIVVNRDGIRHKIICHPKDEYVMVKEQSDYGWVDSSSQNINPERFPLRILSQGQVAAMAADNRQALLDIIDEASQVTELKSLLEEHKRTYYALQARLRELDGKLAGKSEVEWKIKDTNRKLEAFSQSEYTKILEAHQKIVHQADEVEALQRQLTKHLCAFNDFIETIIIDDWPDDYFDKEKDTEILQWRKKAEKSIAELTSSLKNISAEYQEKLEQLNKEEDYLQWSNKADEIEKEYEKLKTQLAEQGVDDPAEFGKLVTLNQQLKAELKQHIIWENDRTDLIKQIGEQEKNILKARKEITAARADFLKNNLSDNTFVKIEVKPFGYDHSVIEQQLRELIDVTDGRFEKDILEYEGNEPKNGLIARILSEDDVLQALIEVKAELLLENPQFGGNLQNYLQKKIENNMPEFFDRIRVWYPEDDLKIQYNRDDKFVSIEQGSKGQRAAALLAFLLAFGSEPIVLDQPEDDLDNHLIYNLIVKQIRENKLRRQLIIVTHNPNIVVNGDSEMVHTFDFSGQCFVKTKGALQEPSVRKEVCEIMEGGREAFERRWSRLGRGIIDEIK